MQYITIISQRDIGQARLYKLAKALSDCASTMMINVYNLSSATQQGSLRMVRSSARTQVDRKLHSSAKTPQRPSAKALNEAADAAASWLREAAAAAERMSPAGDK